jgi:hypothetical protein
MPTAVTNAKQKALTKRSGAAASKLIDHCREWKVAAKPFASLPTLA